MQFCEKCGTILKMKDISNPKLHCNICNTEHPIKSHILLEYKKTEKKSSYDEIMEVILDDTLPRIRMKCLNCNNDKIKYIKNKLTLKNKYYCGECLTLWE